MYPWDGKYFWTADYAGTNRAFQIDPVTGNNIKTINLANATNYMDGLEYFNGKLIGNRCDGGIAGCGIYDVYDLDGTVLSSAFITSVDPNLQSTGIAFDGTNFWVSNIYTNSLSEFDGVTGAFIKNVNLIPKTPGDTFLIEDLSVDYAQRPDTGGKVPEPSAVFGLIGLAALGAKSAFKRKPQS